MGSETGWCEAPLDIIFLVVNQKELSLADVGRMATVCKRWRSIIVENNWFGLHVNANIGNTPLIPWLMLPESESWKDGYRGFYNPATHEASKVYLPEAKGRRCCGSGYGWIVSIGQDMEINLLNLLTREQLSLPPQFTFTEYGYTTNEELHAEYTNEDLLSIFITKAILTCNPSEGECAVVAVLAAEADFQVVFAKPGDAAWIRLPHLHPIWGEVPLVQDLVFHQGKLFCITFHSDLIVFDLHGDPKHGWEVISSKLRDTHKHVFEQAWKDLRHCQFNYYLLQIAGELVAVVRGKENRSRKNGNKYQTRMVAVFKLLQGGEWCQMKDIGDCCFFLGTNESTCLSPAPRGFRPNCIYFTDDSYFIPKTFHTIVGHDMVVYSMDNNQFTPLYHGSHVLLSQFSPSLWVTLSSA